MQPQNEERRAISPIPLDLRALEDVKLGLHDGTVRLSTEGNFDFAPGAESGKVTMVSFSCELGENQPGTYTLSMRVGDPRNLRQRYDLRDLDVSLARLTHVDTPLVKGVVYEEDPTRVNFHGLAMNDTYVFISSDQGGIPVDRPPAPRGRALRAKVSPPDSSPDSSGTYDLQDEEIGAAAAGVVRRR